MKFKTVLVTSCVTWLIACVQGTASGQSLQKELKDVDIANHWIYDNWEAARAKAAADKKPIFAVFR